MTRSRKLAELATAYDTGGLSSFKNRIINGDMRIDQRNAGASKTIALTDWSGKNVTDRFGVYREIPSAVIAGAQVMVPVSFLVTKRATPTITYGSLGTSANVSAYALDGSSLGGVRFYATGAALGQVNASFSTDGITLSSEL